MQQMPLIPDESKRWVISPPKVPSLREYEALGKVRLSTNFIMRDFLFSSDAAARGINNFPEDPEMVIRAGKALCEKVLEPVLERWGRFAITFAYQSRAALEHSWPKEKRETKARNSNPHHYDRKSWGDEVYCRVTGGVFLIL